MNLAYHILLADDHARFRQEIKKLINGIPGVRVTAEVGEGHELYALLEKSPPDLILLDISMPDLQGMKATKEIKSKYPEVKVIIMAMDGEDEYLSHAITAGADGILLKQNMRQGSRDGYPRASSWTTIFSPAPGDRKIRRQSCRVKLF